MTFYAKEENIKLSSSSPYARRKRNHRCQRQAGGTRLAMTESFPFTAVVRHLK